MIEEANSKPTIAVIKIGSGLLTSNGEGLNTTMIDSWGRAICPIKVYGASCCYSFIRCGCRGY